MTGALPEDVATLFRIERELPPADPVRQATVREHLVRTLGLGGPPAPPAAGGLAGTLPGALIGSLIVTAVAAGAVAVQFLGRSNRPVTTAPARAVEPPAAARVAPRLVAAPWVLQAPAASAPAAATGGEPPDWFGQLGAPARPIGGRVTLDDRPVAGATVTLTSPATGPGGIPVIRAATDEAGRFRFAPQPAWRYLVAAEFPGATAATSSVDLRRPGTGADVVLALTACAFAVDGTVSDRGGGAIAGARVIALGDPWSGPSAVTDTNGRYRLCRPPGPTRLRVEANGYGALTRFITVSSGAAHVDFALAEESVLSGIVRGPDGRPRARAQINVWHRRPGDADAEAPGDGHAVTDGDGRFEIAGLAAGEYAVNAWTRDASTLSPHRVTLGEASRTDLDVPLEPTARITGSVTRNGAAVPGALVATTAARTPELRSFQARSQEDGRFVLHGVPLGEVVLTVDGATIIRSLIVPAQGLAGIIVVLDETANR